MGKTHEYTLVASADFTEKLGCAVVIGDALVHGTPEADIAGAGVAIDGIITDITAPGTKGAPVAVARAGDIVLAKTEGAITVGAELEVGTDGALKAKASGVVVAKALASSSEGSDRIPVLIK